MKLNDSDLLLTYTGIITYLAYAVFWLTLTIGGCGYAVFVLGHSGWWFALAVPLAGCGYKPLRWRQLWDTSITDELVDQEQ